jgi:NDP-sugar pyrophosphorylase family protein
MKNFLPIITLCSLVLVPVLGKPLLAWTLERLPQNVDEIIIVTGWLGEKISTEFGSSHNNRPIHYATQNPINKHSAIAGVICIFQNTNKS